jgi:hypothetical protein
MVVAECRKDKPWGGRLRSFRLNTAMAEFLRQEFYRHDDIAYHSKKQDRLPAHPVPDDMATAVLHPDYLLVVVAHDEAESQVRNPYEQALIEPVLRTLADPSLYGLDANEGLGIVVLDANFVPAVVPWKMLRWLRTDR